MEYEANAPALIYISLDSIDRGIAAEGGGYTEMENMEGEDCLHEVEKLCFEKLEQRLRGDREMSRHTMVE
ncbi:hypothetical protein HYALB_00003614 [Hymenoscyphus albidus]|uniref:Uncharacterized protein n=1 Tax=Hymenoscyphus albidus TaxID=595503 RepID=A0A9N9LWG9_9HELO|nr:hypothetical protein HYALB_00003614 [Hymenoscyphus albidus]